MGFSAWVDLLVIDFFDNSTYQIEVLWSFIEAYATPIIDTSVFVLFVWMLVAEIVVKPRAQRSQAQPARKK